MGTGIGVGIAGQVYDLKPGGSTPPPSFTNLYAMKFDNNPLGNNQFLEPTATPLLGSGGSGPWTISFWFYANALGSTNQRLVDINQGAGGGADRLQIYINTSNVLAVAGVWTDNYNSFALSTATWYNLIYRYDGSNVAGFVINGTNIDNKTGVGTSNFSTSGNTRIGRNSAGGQFDGYMDEFSIWGTELSDAECNEIYNSGTPADLSASSMAGNLRHWWRMGDPNGTSYYPAIPDAGLAGSIDLTMTNMVAGNIQTVIVP